MVVRKVSGIEPIDGVLDLPVSSVDEPSLVILQDSIDESSDKAITPNAVNIHTEKVASTDDFGHVKLDGVTIFTNDDGSIGTTPLSATPFSFRSFEAVGLSLGDTLVYDITPDIALVIKRVVSGGSVSAALKSIHGVEIAEVDVVWRAVSTYNLDGGTLGADEVKTIDAGIYVNNTEDIYCYIRYNDRVFHCDIMISGYLDKGNRFFVTSREL